MVRRSSLGQVTRCITMPHFMPIGQNVVEMTILPPDAMPATNRQIGRPIWQCVSAQGSAFWRSRWLCSKFFGKTFLNLHFKGVNRHFKPAA